MGCMCSFPARALKNSGPGHFGKRGRGRCYSSSHAVKPGDHLVFVDSAFDILQKICFNICVGGGVPEEARRGTQLPWI